MRDPTEVTIKSFTASIVFGSFMLIGGLPAAAGQPTAVLGSSAPIRLAAAGDSSGARDTYTQKVRAEMREWQRKLISVNEKAEAKGKEASTAAENDLHKAGTKADIASHELQTVGAEGWKSAKTTFETASRRLAADAWDKVRPPGQVSGTARNREDYPVGMSAVDASATCTEHKADLTSGQNRSKKIN